MLDEYQRNNRILSNVWLYGGMALLAAILYVAAFDPNIPLWIALSLAVAVGFGMIGYGVRLQTLANSDSLHSVGHASEAEISPASGAKGFLPSSAEAWNMFYHLAFCAMLSVPIIFFIPLLWLAQAGDSWPIAIGRIAWGAAAIAASRWWISFSQMIQLNFLSGTGDVATAVLETPATELGKGRQAAGRNWELVGVAAVAFLLAYFFAYHNHPQPIDADSSRRVSGTARLLVWCHENPNTVVTAAVLVGAAYLGMAGYRMVPCRVAPPRSVSDNELLRNERR